MERQLRTTMSYKREWPFTNGKKQIAEDSEGYSFLRSLDESRILRNKSDLANIPHDASSALLYLYTISLYVLSQESNTALEAREYTSRVSVLNNFDNFRVSLPDLYNLAHIYFGDISYGDIDIVSTFRRDRNLEGLYIRFMRGIAQEKNVSSLYLPLMTKIEKVLQIDNSIYKEIRRTASSWNNLSSDQKQKVFRKLTRYIKTINRRADILPLLTQQVGIISALSGKQKTALGVAVFASGVLAGYHMTRNKQK
jgi:hypothetical protein